MVAAAITGGSRSLKQLRHCIAWSYRADYRLFCSGASSTPPTLPPSPPPPPPLPPTTEETALPPTTEETALPPKTEEAEPAEPERNKVMVLGGSGFVGSYVCKEAIVRGFPVASLNRSGRPRIDEPWVNKVEWIRGNLFEPASLGDKFHDVSAVISCVGGFGTHDSMRKINGDANINAVNAAADAGVKRFVYISATDLGFASYLLRGYFEGKKAAEQAVRERFLYSGVILRPGFIHGNRRVGNFQIPLGVIGTPLEMAFRNLKSVSTVPILGQMLVPPVKASTVAKAAIRAAVDNAVPPGVLDVWGILRLGDHY